MESINNEESEEKIEKPDARKSKIFFLMSALPHHAWLLVMQWKENKVTMVVLKPKGNSKAPKFRGSFFEDNNTTRGNKFSIKRAKVE